MANPAPNLETRQALVRNLMMARRAVRSARAAGEDTPETEAHAAVDMRTMRSASAAPCSGRTERRISAGHDEGDALRGLLAALPEGEA
jgi:hypothetical protein